MSRSKRARHSIESALALKTRAGRGWGTVAAVALALQICGAVGTAAASEKRYGARLDWLVLKETLPSGHLFVHERGARLEGFLTVSRTVWGRSEITYRGARYGSLLRHQGDDPSRFTIPEGTEDTTGGQIGTRHSAALYTPIAASTRLEAGLVAAAGIDVWYRALSYYEIWQVPSGSLGLRLESRATARTVVGEVGIRRSTHSRVRTQTKKAPWNASRNTTLTLGDRSNLYGTVAVGLENGWKLALHYEEQLFGASPVYPLDSGVSIFQPRTTIRRVGIAGTLAF